MVDPLAGIKKTASKVTAQPCSSNNGVLAVIKLLLLKLLAVFLRSYCNSPSAIANASLYLATASLKAPKFL